MARHQTGKCASQASRGALRRHGRNSVSCPERAPRTEGEWPTPWIAPAFPHWSLQGARGDERTLRSEVPS